MLGGLDSFLYSFFELLFYVFANNGNVKIVPYDTPMFDVLLMIIQSNLQLGQVKARP